MFDDVWRLPLSRTGEPLGPWTAAGTLPGRRAGRMFRVGGGARRAVTGQTLMAPVE